MPYSGKKCRSKYTVRYFQIIAKAMLPEIWLLAPIIPMITLQTFPTGTPISYKGLKSHTAILASFSTWQLPVSVGTMLQMCHKASEHCSEWCLATRKRGLRIHQATSLPMWGKVFLIHSNHSWEYNSCTCWDKHKCILSFMHKLSAFLQTLLILQRFQWLGIHGSTLLLSKHMMKLEIWMKTEPSREAY